MTDGQLLLAVFTSFYLVECVHWVPLGSTILSTWATRRGWSARSPLAMLSAPGKGMAFAWPLPLLGGFMAADPWPVIPDEEGLWITQAPVRRLSWSEITPRLDSKQVRLTSTAGVACASLRAARQLLSFLQEAKAQQGSDRERRIETWWHQSLSLPAARAAVRRYRIAASVLRFPCNFVFSLCFLWLPFLFWYQGGSAVLPAFGSLLLANGLIAVTWRYLDRRIFAGDPRARWPQVLHLITMPAHTMRAHDLLGLDLLGNLHPLAASASLLPREVLRANAARTWRHWRHIGPRDPLAGAAIEVQPRLKSLCERLGFSPTDLEVSPTRHPDTHSYCPRCHAQFRLTSTACRDCQGTETVAW